MAETMTRKSLRAEMPTVAGWIDDLREAFGAEEINDLIRRGQAGEMTFYASESGREIGTKRLHEPNVWRLEGIDQRVFCKGCRGECVGTDQPCHQSSSP